MKTFSDFGIDLKGKSGVEVYTQCPQCSSERKKKKVPCLSVSVEKQCWNCHHCGWSGRLTSIGKKSENLHWDKPAYRKPEQAPKTELPEKVITWFKGRGISEEILRRNRIGYSSVYMPQIEDYVEAISFPYFRGEELVNIKWRDFQKNFRQEPGAEQIFYGLNDLEETTIICEGELDKLSLEVGGYKNVVSVPAGAPSEKSKDYSSKFSFLNEPTLEKVKKWIIAVDGDGPGKVLEMELTRRLGYENCEKVTWPEGCKDANDVLLKYGVTELQGCIFKSQPYPIEGIFGLTDVEENLDRVYSEGWPKGSSTGFRSLDDLYTVLPGQLTIVTGIPSHGKSEWLDAVAMHLSDDGWKFGFFSPENHPIEFHIAKLIEKYSGRRFGADKMGSEVYREAKLWVDNHFKFIFPDETGLDNILKLAKALVRREGITGLIIDPWNELEHARAASMNETEHISISLGKTRKFARQNGVHVFLVAHPMKLQKNQNGKYPVPTPYDISGSAHFRNKADNCITVWRDELSDAKPVEIHIQKVRFRWVGKPGMASLRWDPRTTRYLEI